MYLWVIEHSGDIINQEYDSRAWLRGNTSNTDRTAYMNRDTETLWDS